MSDETEDTSSSFYFPQDSILTSRNLYLFLLDYYKLVDLFFFTVRLAHQADNMALTASKALLSSAKNKKDRQRYQDIIDSPARSAKKLSEFGSLNSRNLTVNTVDSFLWFISSTLQSAMRKKPEILKSGESIKIEDIFDFNNKKDLINYLIDRKINSLSYGGMSKVEKFIDESMGVSIFPDTEARELMQIFVEVRNIHVHNRGHVNRIFQSRAPQHKKFQFVEGTRAHLDFDRLVILTRVSVQTAIHLDTQICKKFSIERKRYSTWKKNWAASKLGSEKAV